MVAHRFWRPRPADYRSVERIVGERTTHVALHRRDLTRDPISLRDAVDRIVRDNIMRPAADLVTQIAGSLPLDVYETPQAFVVEASLPGLTANDVTITAQGDTLTIRGEARAAEASGERTWLLRERRMSPFQRSIEFPSPIDPERAEARFENGVLMLSLPKAQTAQPTRIQVQSGTEAGQSANPPPQAQPTFPGEQDRIAPIAEAEDRDSVDEASMASFPASDPPSGISERSFTGA
jgi:HSP20 family protein